VDEVRIIVNGEVVHTETDLPVPADPLGVADLLRLDLSLPLDDLITGSGDAWIVVEAGRALVGNGDLNCDGIPDTGDNNGDGKFDWRDVDGLEEDPELNCLEYDDVGPMGEPEPPERDSADWTYQLVVPDGYVSAFTNPLVLDRDGGGFGGAR
jgi:hypothetical protein